MGWGFFSLGRLLARTVLQNLKAERFTGATTHSITVFVLKLPACTLLELDVNRNDIESRIHENQQGMELADSSHFLMVIHRTRSAWPSSRK